MADPTTDLPELDNPEIHHQHRDVSGGWLRPSVFGMMDGLVTNFALLLGLSGGHASHRVVVLGGLASLLAGALSMASGEYVSVQSQNESTRAEVEVERKELRHNAAAELAELTQMYVARGVDADTAAKVARQLSEDPDQALLIHAQEELGVDPTQLPSPYVAALSSLVWFSIGAVVPLLPFVAGAHTALASSIVSLLALFAAGAVSSRFTARTWVFAGSRQLLIGAFAAAVTYGIGSLFHVGGVG